MLCKKSSAATIFMSAPNYKQTEKRLRKTATALKFLSDYSILPASVGTTEGKSSKVFF